MASENKTFDKYIKRNPGYHWGQVGTSILNKNLYTIARYKIVEQILCNEIGGKKVLDLGCGDGVLASLLSKNNSAVTGIDSDSDAINYAKKQLASNKKINFIQSSCINTPLLDKSFEVIVSTEVIEHLENPDLLLDEIDRLWDKNGKIIITTPIRLTNAPLDKMHYREYFEDQFYNLLRKRFKKIDIIKSHPVFWMELQNKNVLIKYILNVLHLIFNFNPFLQTTGWRYYSQQTAVISG